MKYLSILFIALFLTAGISSTAQAQEDAISKYFSKYVDDERFTVVYVSGKMFQMINKMELDLDDEEAQAVMSVVKDLKGLRILTTDTDGAKFYKEALATINTKGYETLLEVREGNEQNVKFLVKDSNSGSTLNELLLLVGGDDEDFVLLSFIGNIDISQVGKLSKAFNEDGEKKEAKGAKQKKD